MAAFSIKTIVLGKGPTDDGNARDISLFLTRSHGSDGWEPVTAYQLGEKLVVMLTNTPIIYRTSALIRVGQSRYATGFGGV